MFGGFDAFRPLAGLADGLAAALAGARIAGLYITGMAAMASSARCSCGGSVFPRFTARRIIPADALGERQYFGGASAIRMEASEHTCPPWP